MSGLFISIEARASGNIHYLMELVDDGEKIY
jgi:hypothetical protein